MPGLWENPFNFSPGVMVTDTILNRYVSSLLSALKNDHMLCCGRMTLTTALPVTTADVTGASTVYFTPFRGNLIAVHDGDNWQVVAFPELSLALGSDAANTNYDLFAYYTSGSVALERTAWTNATTRATALTLLDGVLVKSSDTSRRYLGTYRTTGTIGQTDDSISKRFVWNYYNRVRRRLAIVDGTDTWTYTTATFRYANGNASNQVDVVVGIAETILDLRAIGVATNSGSAAVAVGIGEDSSSAAAPGSIMANATAATAAGIPSAHIVRMPSIGYHFYAWLEFSAASGTTTWYGDNAAPTNFQTGVVGSIEG